MSDPTTSPPESPVTVDLTATVQALGDSFTDWGTAYLVSAVASIPAFRWVSFPIIRNLIEATVRGLLNVLVRSVVMEAFFMSTAVKGTTTSKLYLAAVNKKRALSGAASDEEYLRAEQAEIDCFRDLVVLNR